MDYKRVYHPTLNAWQDVPAAQVEEWGKAGWLKARPKHVDDSGALPAGSGYTHPVAIGPSSDGQPSPEPRPAK